MNEHLLFVALEGISDEILMMIISIMMMMMISMFKMIKWWVIESTYKILCLSSNFTSFTCLTCLTSRYINILAEKVPTGILLISLKNATWNLVGERFNYTFILSKQLLTLRKVRGARLLRNCSIDISRQVGIFLWNFLNELVAW